MIKDINIAELNGDDIKLHIILGSDRNPYRERISHQTFMEVQLKFHDRRFRTPYPWWEYSETIEHKNLWEFYEAIGWNYKRKKFI